MKTTRATTWAVRIAIVLTLAVLATASAASGSLSENSPPGENSLGYGLHRSWAAVSGEGHRGCGEPCPGTAAGSVVAPTSRTAVEALADSYRGQAASVRP